VIIQSNGLVFTFGIGTLSKSLHLLLGKKNLFIYLCFFFKSFPIIRYCCIFHFFVDIFVDLIAVSIYDIEVINLGQGISIVQRL